ncbi:YezD family protein [Acetonema longum]|uniref:DUF2292 domain-containing protein n=1 Tax=Acetonema longum DSM 6540 TaxID=1009370 RepID=F7NHC3_9FIRM|nr:YezD family protein [Acetonema longum]EGO64606.1 hypothetical protein ALO_07343 [Acetonema longum DSM 6540]
MLPKDLTVNSLERAVLAQIEDSIRKIEHGSITLIVQDGRLIQMDVIQKVRFTAAPEKPDKGSPKHSEAKVSLSGQVAAALKGMKFGQVVLVIKDGRIVQVERTEKQRFPNLEGIYGEGI